MTCLKKMSDSLCLLFATHFFHVLHYVAEAAVKNRDLKSIQLCFASSNHVVMVQCVYKVFFGKGQTDCLHQHH